MFTAEISGFDRIRARLADAPRQARYAASRALNTTAFEVRTRLMTSMRAVFDRPTPYITNSLWVGKKAEPSSLEVWVYPRERGGKGVSPEKVLLANVVGGRRRNKRAERALQLAGILPAGLAMVPATWVVEQYGDGYGNVKGSFFVRLLSYFRSFGEQGYRSNMSDDKRRRLAKRGRTKGPQRFRRGGKLFKGLATIRGVEYFVSRGKGEFTGRGSWRHGRQQHLAAGIWQRSGIHGSNVKPVFLFVRMPRYRVRLPWWGLAREVLHETFPAQFRQEFARAMQTAR